MSLAPFFVISEMDPLETIDAANVILDCVRTSKTMVIPEKLVLPTAPKFRETVARRFPHASSCESSIKVELPDNAPEKRDTAPLGET